MSDKQFFTLVGLGVFAFWSLTVSARKAAAATGNAINPLNDENIFYSGVNAIGDTFDNGAADDSFTLGGWLWDITHPEWRDGIPEGN